MPSLMDLLEENVKTEQDFDYETHLADAMHSISISLMDVSVEERKRSYRLEEEIHEAWGENRQADFVRLVDEWRMIFQIQRRTKNERIQ